MENFQFTPSIQYPEVERPKVSRLQRLFSDWHQAFTNSTESLKKHVADDMVFDGFYPYYFSQPKRILFVGWESRQIGGFNYLDIIYQAYREGKQIGRRHLDNDNFHSRMLYFAYGILNGMPNWQEIPFASKIGDTFGSPDGISFAFMNISKLSNEAENHQADKSVIDAAFQLSTHPRNYIQEEVSILEPEIVITCNLNDKADALGKCAYIRHFGSENQVAACWLDSGKHRSLLLDTFHFSAWNKKDPTDFYEPICEAIASCFKSFSD